MIQQMTQVNTMNQHEPRYVALIPAAGVGARMAGAGPKQYMAIGGKPMLRHTIDAFLSSELIHHVYVVVSPDDAQIDAIVPATRSPHGFAAHRNPHRRGGGL